MRKLPQQTLDNMTTEEYFHYTANEDLLDKFNNELDSIEARLQSEIEAEFEEDTNSLWMEAEHYGYDRGFREGRNSVLCEDQ